LAVIDSPRWRDVIRAFVDDAELFSTDYVFAFVSGQLSGDRSLSSFGFPPGDPTYK
jgi:hypothetical protein